MASIIKNKKIYITVEDQCFSFFVNDLVVTKVLENDFQCFHEEADTRIIFHISRCHPNTKVMVNASDTDILVILLGNFYKFGNLEIWLSTKCRKKDITYINCSELAKNLGPKLCRSLPAFHAFTGCDYTAAFFKKGKIKPFDYLVQNEQLQIVFGSLTHKSGISDNEKMDVIQQYTVRLYNIKNCTSVNAARFENFQQFYASRNKDENFISNIKNFNSCLIPPCWRSVEQKIVRTIFINSM